MVIEIWAIDKDNIIYRETRVTQQSWCTPPLFRLYSLFTIQEPAVHFQQDANSP